LDFSGEKILSMPSFSSFSGLVVSMLASGTKIAGLLLAEAVGFFPAKESSACLPSEGK
jgi:hypothetical protein